MERPAKIRGRVWVLRDAGGGRIDDIDTDMIYHNAHLAVTSVSEMGRYALGNLKGWEDFPRKARPGDIVVAGVNFGAGSSRQHAVDCFASLGVQAVIAESFGAIYKRNAINSGMAVIECPGVFDSGTVSGDVLDVDFPSGRIFNETRGAALQARPFSSVQLDIYRAGNLFEYGRTAAGT